jgi:hypothetical protein
MTEPQRLSEQELERGLREALEQLYGLLRAGEVDNALHALDAFLIRNGINPKSALSTVPEPAETERSG